MASCASQFDLPQLTTEQLNFRAFLHRPKNAMNNQNQPRKKSTLEQVESWLEVASQLGYRVRYDHFGGTGGGVCEFGGQKWIFMDVSLSAFEHLAQLEEAIPLDPLYGTLNREGGTLNQEANATRSRAA
jgi:hypothetical protein